jgi:hypothetical protein
MSNTLRDKFSHPRDKYIKFYNRGHKYEISCDKNSKYTSVTTWNHKHFPKFDADAIIANIFKSKSWGPEHKYWGQTAEQIKASWKNNGDAVASAGTNLHERIENFMNNDCFENEYIQKELYENYKSINKDKIDEHVEWEYFLHFIKDHPELKPYRTEWMIYDEDGRMREGDNFDLKGKEIMIALTPILRKTQEEIDLVDKSSEATDIDYFTYDQFNYLIKQLESENIKHLLVDGWPENERDEVIEFVKYYTELKGNKNNIPSLENNLGE